MTDVAEGLREPVAAPTPPAARQDVVVTAAKAAASAIAVVALAFGLWRVRSIVVLLLLALTFAAAIRPGVDWLRRHRVPQSLAIGVFFVGVLGAFFLFFWLAIPPALHQISQALAQPVPTSGAAGGSTGIRHDVLAWVDRQLHELPSGSQVLHRVAAYGHKATEVVVAVFFTLAASWYWVSERDKMIDLLSLLAPEAKRDKARQTYLAIDQRLGSYTRLKFIMIFVILPELRDQSPCDGALGRAVADGDARVRLRGGSRLRRHRRDPGRAGGVGRRDVDRRLRARPRPATGGSPRAPGAPGPDALDPFDGGDAALVDGSAERGVVALVDGGVRGGEGGDGLVEGVALAEVGGDRDPVT
jgi:AI-2E family transporter